jgi:tetratricopeptide (TPR) repeat protein
LKIARDIEDAKIEGLVLEYIGIAYAKVGDYPKAINYLQQELKVARKLKDRDKEGNALGKLGNVYQ